MFECRACMRRCLQGILRDGLRARPGVRTRSPVYPIQLQNRRAHTAPNLKPDTSQDDDEVDAFSSHLPEDALTKPKGSKKYPGVSSNDRRAANIEVQYLHDPLKLANHVRSTLSRRPGKAIEICRLAASKGMNCVVGWNHCIDYLMTVGQVDNALKIYNEMKKRAQFPDSYTYTILLRGFVHKPQMLQKALAVYNSMSSPTSRVQPLTIHANSVLEVCCAAHDMDALWGIVSNLPATGGRSPDHITYSIILKAIHQSTLQDTEDIDDQAQLTKAVQKAVDEGRRIWQDVVNRWRRGELNVDERLVYEMSQVLLLSPRIEDWDDVLNLVEQTTQMKRLLPRLGSPERHSDHVPRSKVAEKESADNDGGDGWEDAPATLAFKPIKAVVVDSKQPGPPTSLVWVPPGPLILSAVVHTCTAMREPRGAEAYWEALVKDRKVQPNKQNIINMLSLFRYNRSSYKAAQLLQETHLLPNFEGTNMIFRIAMATCTRDWKNPQVIENANTILDIMAISQPYPDAHSLAKYTSLILTAKDGEHLQAGLDRLGPSIHIMRTRVTFGADKKRLAPQQHRENKVDCVLFLRTVIGAIDVLIQRGQLSHTDLQEWQSRKAQLSAFVERFSRILDDTRQHDEDVRERARQYKFAKQALRARLIDMQAVGRGPLMMNKQKWAERLERYKRSAANKKSQSGATKSFLNSAQGRDSGTGPTLRYYVSED